MIFVRPNDFHWFFSSTKFNWVTWKSFQTLWSKNSLCWLAFKQSSKIVRRTKTKIWNCKGMRHSVFTKKTQMTQLSNWGAKCQHEWHKNNQGELNCQIKQNDETVFDVQWSNWQAKLVQCHSDKGSLVRIECKSKTNSTRKNAITTISNKSAWKNTLVFWRMSSQELQPKIDLTKCQNSCEEIKTANQTWCQHKWILETAPCCHESMLMAETCLLLNLICFSTEGF